MTETELAMMSEWMPNGNINQYVKKHQDADRFELVSPSKLFPPPSVVDDYAVFAVERRHEGFNLRA